MRLAPTPYLAKLERLQDLLFVLGVPCLVFEAPRLVRGVHSLMPAVARPVFGVAYFVLGAARSVPGADSSEPDIARHPA